MKNPLCAVLALMLLATACATTRLRTEFDDVPLPTGLTYHPQPGRAAGPGTGEDGEPRGGERGCVPDPRVDTRDALAVGANDRQCRAVVRSARTGLLHRSLLEVSRGPLTHRARRALTHPVFPDTRWALRPLARASSTGRRRRHARRRTPWRSRFLPRSKCARWPADAACR